MFLFDNVLVVEDINKKREPLQTMEGVYLITPSEDSVRGLIRDFESPTRPLYKGAHVFFTEGNPVIIILSISWLSTMEPIRSSNECPEYLRVDVILLTNINVSPLNL